MLLSGVGHLSGNSKLSKIFQRRDCIFFTFVLPVPIIGASTKDLFSNFYLRSNNQHTPAKENLT